MSCKKHPHKSRGAAEAQLRSLQQKGNDAKDADRLNVYRCDRCFQWHVGHTKVGAHVNRYKQQGARA